MAKPKKLSTILDKSYKKFRELSRNIISQKYQEHNKKLIKSYTIEYIKDSGMINSQLIVFDDDSELKITRELIKEFNNNQDFIISNNQ